MRTSSWWRRLFAAVALILLLIAPAGAEDPPDPADGVDEADASETPLDDAAARDLASRLTKAAGGKDAQVALRLLDEVAGRAHAALHKPLLKLVKYRVEKVAIAALDALSVQRGKRERDSAKLAKSVWKLGFSDKVNAFRYNVRGRAVRTVASITGEPLQDKCFRDVRSMWHLMIETRAEKSYAPAIVDVCRYVKQTKDKRFAKMLALQIEMPEPVDVNDPNNPPASYWQKRYEQWIEFNAEAIEALEELTGESFKMVADAEAWIKAHRQEGFRWR